ncbi:MAG TPA: trypsin-like peptidase domain-containing protein [Verrucomicrobiae bacterium]|nr:trypsin-like peptidase domain-containing protein [Verrucomicrobiae bacterium]
MAASPERVVAASPDAVLGESIRNSFEAAGYSVAVFASAPEAIDDIRRSGADLLLVDAPAGAASVHESIAAIRGSASTEAVRIVLIVPASPGDRTAALDLGADDALSKPFDSGELVARVRAQLRARRAGAQLLDKVRLAEEGQQIAHTAFEALAVTEKMTSDAFSLDRRLKIGVGVFFAIAIAMAGIYFLFAGNARKQTQVNNALITRLETGLRHQQDFIAQVRKIRSEEESSSTGAAGKEQLQKQAAELKAQMSDADAGEVASLQKELEETDARLKRVEQQDDAAETLISADVKSVCLLHVVVAFRNVEAGKRLRYAGLNPKGEPLQDSDGNPVLTLEGNGPEVTLDVFGTGFLVSPAGRVLTNRHVAEPWWKNDDISTLTNQGFQAEISSIHAYFPGDPRAFHAEIQQISQDADLATMQVDMQDLQRAILKTDPGATAAVSGEPIVAMGYATGLAAILARTDEDTAQKIVDASNGDVSEVLTELAKRNLIRPLITQGHIGDVLPDKIVFDAQTTSGGSGGPLFNHEGKVIGVTVAVLKGFEGSNFGIPIKFSKPLLGN